VLVHELRPLTCTMQEGKTEFMVTEDKGPYLGSKGKKKERGRTRDELLGIIELRMSSFPHGLQEPH